MILGYRPLTYIYTTMRTRRWQQAADPEERKKSYIENLRKVILSFADEHPEIISPSTIEAFFQSTLQETKDNKRLQEEL